jgi:hypothetical protein
MKIKGLAQRLFSVVLLSSAGMVAVSCCYSNDVNEEHAQAHSRPVNSELDNPFVFIALIGDDKSLEVAKLVKIALRERGIESSIEGGGAGLSVSVRKHDVEMAVKTIAAAPDLRGKRIALNEDLLYLVNGKPQKKPDRKPFVVIAQIKDGASKETAEMLLLELLKRDTIAPTLESEGAGFRILVSQDEIEKAVKAIAAPPDLREKGISIKEEYLHLLK